MEAAATPMPVTHPARVAVVGLGNVLQGDDAFGPYVIRVLQARFDLDPRVEVQDLGTPGLHLIAHLAGIDALIVVDTVRFDAPPGSVRTYRRHEVLRHPPQPRSSPHEPGLKEALLVAELAGGGPAELLLVGAVPERVDTALGLSAPVRRAVDRAVEEVGRELARLGLPPLPRAHPAPPAVWWEEPLGPTRPSP
jgi:hydrogenase maturation protease